MRSSLLSFTVRVDESPLYEMLASLTVYLSKKNYYDLGDKWKKEIQGSSLEKLEENKWLPKLCYAYPIIAESPYKQDVNAFLGWLEELSEGQIYEIISPYMTEDRIFGGLHEFRHMIAGMLRTWSEVYQIAEAWQGMIRQSADHMRRSAADMGPKDAVEMATNGIRLEPAEGVDEVWLIPSYHLKPLNLIYFLGRTVIIQYSLMEEEASDASAPPEKVLRVLRGLNDEKRLRILRILAKGPLSFSDLVENTKLSKSNLHYHLTLLRTSGLIRILNPYPQSGDRYELRQRSFESVKKWLEAYIVAEDDRDA